MASGIFRPSLVAGSAPLIALRDVSRFYVGAGGVVTRALDGITFAIERGEFVAVMGPSGSGKTTLLNMMAGLDLPNGGDIVIGGNDLAALRDDELADFRRTKLGFVFQDFNLLDTLTLSENVALPLMLGGRLDRSRVLQVMSLLGIADLADRFPFQVSGGQQQRAAVARAIVHRPAVVLADEPAGNLDSKAATALLSQFVELNRDHGVSIIMVTHDLRAASRASRVLVACDGRLFASLARDGRSDAEFYGAVATVTAALELSASE